jgi:hypothetical protein
MNDNPIVRQFTMQSVWDRLGRAVVGAIAYCTGIQGLPHTEVEWIGFVGVVAGAIWTGRNTK